MQQDQDNNPSQQPDFYRRASFPVRDLRVLAEGVQEALDEKRFIDAAAMIEPQLAHLEAAPLLTQIHFLQQLHHIYLRLERREDAQRITEQLRALNNTAPRGSLSQLAPEVEIARREFREGAHEAALSRVTKLREDCSADPRGIENAGYLLRLEAHFLTQMQREGDAVKRTQDWLGHHMTANQGIPEWRTAIVEAFFLLADLAWHRGDGERFVANSKTALILANMETEKRPALSSVARERLIMALCYAGDFTGAHEQFSSCYLGPNLEANTNPQYSARFLALYGTTQFILGAETRGVELIRAALARHDSNDAWSYAPPREPRSLLNSMWQRLDKGDTLNEAMAIERILLDIGDG